MRALRRYVRLQVWPRRWRILGQPQSILAVLVAAAIALFGHRLAFHHLATDDLITAVFAYAALALGACLTGLTVALTLPDRSFAIFLAAAERDDKPSITAYGDLIFVFSWTAIAHWLVIVLALVMLATVGGHDVPTFAGTWSASAALAVVMIGALVYAMAQFLVTIITLSEVAGVYIAWIRRP